MKIPADYLGVPALKLEEYSIRCIQASLLEQWSLILKFIPNLFDSIDSTYKNLEGYYM